MAFKKDGNIDYRYTYDLIVDTETGYKRTPKEDEGVNPYNSLVYDMAWQIVDKNGFVHKKVEYLVEEFYPIKCRNSYYYNDKAHIYNEKLMNGTIKIAYFDDILKEFLEDIAKYRVKKVYAHNARFDYVAINSTYDYLHKTYREKDVFENITIGCTCRYARTTIGIQKAYKRFCDEHNFLTANGKPRMTAEVLYAYISNNPEHKEEHTALSDVQEETEILLKCKRQHKKANYIVKHEYVK